MSNLACDAVVVGLPPGGVDGVLQQRSTVVHSQTDASRSNALHPRNVIYFQ